MHGPIDNMNVPTGTPFVTKLKTKILFTMDYVLQCETDERSRNGWRLLCTHGIALVRLALDEKKLEGFPETNEWLALAKKCLDAWPPKTYEKTSVVIESNGRYRGLYDHYSVEMQREDLELGMRSLKEEKNTVIVDKMMTLWGDCYSIGLAAGYLNLEEEIEIPV